MSSDSARGGSAVERVARAMAASDSGPEGSTLFDIHWREFGDGYRQGALAALAALAEPTEAMLAAASRLNHPRDVEIWRAMVAAALQEGEDDGR